MDFSFLVNRLIFGGDCLGELVRKRGRPVSERSKSEFCGVRLSREENDMLVYLARVKHKSKSDILIEALRLLYEIDQTQGVDDYYDDYYEDDFDDFDE